MRALLAAFAALTLSACDRGTEVETTDQTVVARTSESELPAWLSPTDGAEPARWLAGREAGRPLPADAPPVRAMRAALDAASVGFIEDPRMIANRTLQLGQMLTEVGKAESYRSLLDGLGKIAALHGRHKSLYGEMCQHYFNTRNRGLDHRAALDDLAEHGVRPRDARQGEGSGRP
jgi:hypothetical protein